MANQKSLKAKNSLVIGSVLAADALLFLAFSASPDFSLQPAWSSGAATRVGMTLLVPVVVLLLGSLIPSSVKAVLVFWLIRHTLPGHRAFTEKTLGDPRIERARLRKNVGEFPSDPTEQNAMWYRLFKKVEQEVSIEHVHGQFLLLRDLASISVLLLAGCVLCWSLGLIFDREALILGSILGSQFLLAALSARSQGQGLVSSVLALHGVKRRV